MISFFPTFFHTQRSLFKIYFNSLKIVLFSVIIGMFVYKGHEAYTEYNSILNLIEHSPHYNDRLNAASKLTFHDRKKIISKFINYDYEGTWKYENINNNSINGICHLTFRHKYSNHNIYYIFDILLFDGNFNNHMYSISNLLSYTTSFENEPFINRKNEKEHIYDVSFDNILIKLDEYVNLKNVNGSSSLSSNITFTYDSINRTTEGKIEIENLNIIFELSSTHNNLVSVLKNFNRIPLIVGIWNIIYYSLILDVLNKREYELIRVNYNISFV